MTILIVSLYLPYTIDFKIKKDDPETPADDVAPETPDLEDVSKLSIFDSNASAGNRKSSVPKADGEAKFFLNLDRPTLKRGPSILNDLPLASSIAPNEPHSPAWGKTDYFTQPQLRAADTLPPSSVLQRKLSNNLNRKPATYETLTTHHSRSNSHDRALKDAEWNVVNSDQGNGGLRNAVAAAMAKGDFDQVTWIGTLGMPTDALDSEKKAAILEKLDTDFDSLVVYVSDSDFSGLYNHFCKTILWPVLHYQIPDNPKNKAYLDHSWKFYVLVNQAFADKVVKSYKRGDVIWIHDYHLLLVPKMVREKLPDAQIGFYLHISFPSSEVFRCLAVRQELLDGMLGANLIGFQTQEYCHHFLQTCNRLLRVESLPHGVQMSDRFVNVATFPIGLYSDITEADKNDPTAIDWVGRLARKYAGKKLIVARDKLDHVRGVRQKLLAFELLLSTYPQFRENIVMIQVATTANKQSDLEATVSDIATRINSTYSSLAYQPLVYLRKDLEHHQFIAMLESADVLMITSLREGMNLTAHEYIRCQDGLHSKKKHGPMILSEFTGCAAVFEPHHLNMNPWDYQRCADAMQKALTMSDDEKEKRWTAANEIVLKNNADHWIRTYLFCLDQAHDQHSRQHTVSIPRLRVNDLAKDYRESTQRLFLLDYEGTLASHGTPLNVNFVSPQRTVRALSDLLEVKGNTVYVMSGRMPSELDKIQVPGLGLIAENGCFIKHPDQEWICLSDMEKMNVWKDSIKKILGYYQERLEGSTIELRNCSIFFNFDQAKDEQTAERLSGECANHLNDACQNLNVHAVPCEGGLLIESTEHNKQKAAESIFEAMKNGQNGIPDFLMVAGDSREDEVVYRWANQLHQEGVIPYVCTVSVSSRNTEAMATLTQGVTGVLGTLQNLASGQLASP